MKKSAKAFLAVMTLVVVAATVSSCSRFGKSKGQSTEFATFIKAYTGGIISDKSTIRVELTSDISDVTPGADIKEGILSFTPSIKGTARWLSQSTIEFIPESGALKPGQAYTGKLRLDKIHKVGSSKFKRFSFNFLVAIKEAVLALDDITITPASPDKASVSGTIAMTEELPIDKVRKMIDYSYPDKSGELTVTAGQDPLNYHFDLVGLNRNDKDNTLRITLKSGDTGLVADSKIET
ncbi:MAG: hypothetical protein IJ840_02945, partial [Bacteroidales bacterium]|nr:hypothetical protein [Bacteroidales bacterium]